MDPVRIAPATPISISASGNAALLDMTRNSLTMARGHLLEARQSAFAAEYARMSDNPSSWSSINGAGIQSAELASSLLKPAVEGFQSLLPAEKTLTEMMRQDSSLLVSNNTGIGLPDPLMLMEVVSAARHDVEKALELLPKPASS